MFAAGQERVSPSCRPLHATSDACLREVLPQYRAVPATTPLYAVYPHQRHLPPKVRAFIDFLAQRFAAYAWDAGH